MKTNHEATKQHEMDGLEQELVDAEQVWPNRLATDLEQQLVERRLARPRAKEGWRHQPRWQPSSWEEAMVLGKRLGLPEAAERVEVVVEEGRNELG